MNQQSIDSLPVKDGFRLRGTEMTRLETFLDAAFAFATTLLVISVGSIPENYQELILALKGVPAFAASFISIVYLWTVHRKWSRRYGLEDSTSTSLSLILIFIILVYVYPLKMIFSALFAWISSGWLPASFSLQNNQELANLFVIYGLGFAVVMLIYSLLYKHALKLKDTLELNELEILKAKNEFVMTVIVSTTAFISALFAFILPLTLAVYAGFVYWSLPVTMSIAQTYYTRKTKKLISPEKSNK